MDALNQIYREAMHPVNVLFTLGLLVVVMYWLLVILGCFGGDEGHADASGSLEAHADGLDLHADGDHGSGGGHEGAPMAQGGTQMLLRFLHVGDVPLMPLLSIALLCLWVASLLANHYLNPGRTLGLAAILLPPNLLLAAVVVHFLAKPLKIAFRAMNQDAAAPAPIAGSLCRIITATADQEFGEAIIERDGAPLQIHVRTAGEVLRDGDRALVVQETEEPGIFLVTLFDPPAIAEIQKLGNKL
jgi:hypothetical protein